MGISHLTKSKISKNLRFRAAQMFKMAVFVCSTWPKLISRKIWVTEKSWSLHIVYSQLGCPGLYLLNGHNFNTRNTKATLEQPVSELQMDLQASGLEQATWNLPNF